jgi:hypothetical protein
VSWDSPGVFESILGQLDRHDTERTKFTSSLSVIKQNQRCDGIQPQEEDFPDMTDKIQNSATTDSQDINP